MTIGLLIMIFPPKMVKEIVDIFETKVVARGKEAGGVTAFYTRKRAV
jgi:hypothetical protein